MVLAASSGLQGSVARIASADQQIVAGYCGVQDISCAFVRKQQSGEKNPMPQLRCVRLSHVSLFKKAVSIKPMNRCVTLSGAPLCPTASQDGRYGV
jgi:hypothetical protein